MGNQKQKWTAEEEEALRAGVRKHGTGKWKNILKDPEFAPFLTNRSNIDLKDKWRNVSISTGQISKDKPKGPRVKAVTAAALSIAPISSVPVSAVEDDAVDDDPSKSPQEGKTSPSPSPRYDSMIFEAISDMKDPKGSDIGAIIRFIEQRHEVPQNFRRLLSSKLRRLVLQGKLEKVQNCFKLKDAALGAKTPTSKEKDVRSRPSQNFGLVTSAEALKDAAISAACMVAEAENKSFVAAEAVKEYERVVKMAEDTDLALLVLKDIYDRCSQGEMVLLKLL